MFRFPCHRCVPGGTSGSSPLKKFPAEQGPAGSCGRNTKFPRHRESYAFAISWLAIISSARTSAE